jgi:predicted lysophospholipase L1 biosynthesis ABC-type transport system permease subunit
VRRRELRGGIGGFRVFLACLVIGVREIAAIGSLSAAVEAGIRAEARTLLGGDVSARLAYRPASEAERRFLEASGTLSESAKLRAMARSLDGERRSLIELQAVDDPIRNGVVSPRRHSRSAPRCGIRRRVRRKSSRPVASRLGLNPGDRSSANRCCVSPRSSGASPMRRRRARLGPRIITPALSRRG